jgi:hypothetical protein
MHWQYTNELTGIAITLDNNVWNFLFQKGIDLALDLPSEEFAIFITREVEMETVAIPAKASTTALKVQRRKSRRMRPVTQVAMRRAYRQPRHHHAHQPGSYAGCGFDGRLHSRIILPQGIAEAKWEAV